MDREKKERFKEDTMGSRIRKGFVLLVTCALLLAGTMVFATGTGEKAPSALTTVTAPLVLTTFGVDPGPFRFAARVIPASDKKAPDDPKVKPIVNVDLYLFSDTFVHIPFDVTQLPRPENGEQPQVLIFLSAAYIQKATGRELGKLQHFYYSDDGKGWKLIEGSKGDTFEFGRTDTYVWLKVTAWPLGDRFIGCD